MAMSKIRPGLVAFIDLLGFSEKVTAAGLNRVKLRWIERAVVSVQDCFASQPKNSVLKDLGLSFDREVLAFSDCLVRFQPMTWPIVTGNRTIAVLAEELRFIALAQAKCVLNGYFLRGGVDLGFWYRRGNTLISPAMVDAYRCERVAQNPVVALSENVTFILLTLPPRLRRCEEVQPIRQLLRQFRRQNGSPVTYLDYIGIALREIQLSTQRSNFARRYDFEKPAEASPNEVLMERRAWLSKHGKRIQEGQAGASRGEDRRKYEFLSVYHAKMARLFDGSNAAIMLS